MNMQEIHLENSSSMPVESAHLAWAAALLGVVLLPLRPIIWALQTLVSLVGVSPHSRADALNLTDPHRTPDAHHQEAPSCLGLPL